MENPWNADAVTAKRLKYLSEAIPSHGSGHCAALKGRLAQRESVRFTRERSQNRKNLGSVRRARSIISVPNLIGRSEYGG